jgi:hypothetical protein
MGKMKDLRPYQSHNFIMFTFLIQFPCLFDFCIRRFDERDGELEKEEQKNHSLTSPHV